MVSNVTLVLKLPRSDEMVITSGIIPHTTLLLYTKRRSQRVKQIYPVSEGYLRKIPVPRTGKIAFAAQTAREICFSSQPVFFANNPH